MNELTNKATMTVYEIAKLCEYASTHKNAMKACETLMLDGDFTGVDSTPVTQSVVYNTKGQTLQSYALNKRQSFAMASRLNVSYLMNVIDRWQELEQVVAKPKSIEVQPVQEIAPLSQVDSFTVLRMMADDFNLPQSGRIGVYATGMQAYPNFVKALPVYAIDAPVIGGSIESNTIGSSSSALAIRDHLKNHGVDLSAKAFNEILVSEGYLEVKHRRSSSSRAVSGWKNYKSVTKKGLEFGKNVTSTRAQRETDPHWYSDKILELFEILKVPTHSS